MQLYLSAYLLDQSPTGVIAAVRVTTFQHGHCEDNTYYLRPSEQLCAGRTISDLALCDLAYTDMYSAARIFPIDPSHYVDSLDATAAIGCQLLLADDIYVPDDITWPALIHRLHLLHHYTRIPQVQVLANLDFFTPIGDLEQHARPRCIRIA